jgi:hypothetical protein
MTFDEYRQIFLDHAETADRWSRTRLIDGISAYFLNDVDVRIEVRGMVLEGRPTVLVLFFYRSTLICRIDLEGTLINDVDKYLKEVSVQRDTVSGT